MDPRSGRIQVVADAAEARAKGLIPVPEEELERVKAMTPEERKKWAESKMKAIPPNRKTRLRALAIQRQTLRRAERLMRRVGGG